MVSRRHSHRRPFVHDWLTLAIVVVVVGHTYKALMDAEARTGVRTGMCRLGGPPASTANGPKSNASAAGLPTRNPSTG